MSRKGFIWSAVCWAVMVTGCAGPSGPGVPVPVFGQVEVTVQDINGLTGQVTLPSGTVVQFIATADGLGGAVAVFEDPLGGDGLVVQLTSGAQAEMEWDGVVLDGYGELTADESAALSGMLDGEVWDVVATVPLVLACKGLDVDPAAMAAMVYPLQTVIKYRMPSHEATLRALAAGAPCAFLTEEEGRPLPDALVMSNAALVPYVPGFFPFDEVGAAGSSSDSEQGLFELLPAIAAAITTPCGAKCRGSCGSDCTLRNCTKTSDWRCEQGASGNTGYKEEWEVFNCGVHPGCVWHDQCFDDCNAKWKCHTWGAAACRHNPLNGCDVQAVATHGALNCAKWATGSGTFTHREDFPYPVAHSGVRDTTACPKAGAASSIPAFDGCEVSIDFHGIWDGPDGAVFEHDDTAKVASYFYNHDTGEYVFQGGVAGNTFTATHGNVDFASGGSSGSASFTASFDPSGILTALEGDHMFVSPFSTRISLSDVPAEDPALPFAEDDFIAWQGEDTAGSFVTKLQVVKEDYEASGPYAARVQMTLKTYTVKSLLVHCFKVAEE
jgi:hypothetical protein